jgi:hypothetical protein
MTMTKLTFTCERHGDTYLHFDRRKKRQVGEATALKAKCGCWFVLRIENAIWKAVAAAAPVEQEEGRKFDADKLRMDLVPFGPLKEIAEVLTFGAKKYSPNNWQFVPNAVERYEAAMLRHITSYKLGEKFDPETGMTHLAHAACCLMFLMHMTKEVN